MGCGHVLDQACLLAHAIDRTAAGATPEDERVSALEHFHPVEVVERAVVFRIVAQSVEIEIGSGLLTAEEDRVALAFAALHRHAGDIAQRFAELADVLVLQLVAGDGSHGLRDIDDRRGRLGGARAIVVGVAIRTLAAHDDVAGKIIAVGIAGIGCGGIDRSGCTCSEHDRAIGCECGGSEGDGGQYQQTRGGVEAVHVIPS